MISRAYDFSALQETGPQREPRTNLFVFATVSDGASSNRVKVRNISSGGAMIEGPVLPRIGTAISLSRGDTTLRGDVVWSSDARVGVKFRGTAVVSQWLPSTNGAQREIDREVELAKAEKRAGLLPSSPAPLPASRQVARDLTRIANALDALSDDLASDPAIVSKFMTKLHILDIAGQTLKKCASELAS